MDKQRPDITVNINGKPRPFTVRHPSEERQPEELLPGAHQSEQRPFEEKRTGGQPAGGRQAGLFQTDGQQTGKERIGAQQSGERPTGRKQAGEQHQEEQHAEKQPTAKQPFAAPTFVGHRPSQHDAEEAAALEEESEPIAPASAAQKKKSGIKRRKGWGIPPHAKSLFAAAVIAALVGMAFGMTMLRLIPKEKAEPSPAAEAMTELAEAGTATDGEREESTIPAPFSIAVIQAGVYSDSKAAARAAKSIQEAGVPVVIAGQKPAALYIAVGTDKEGLRAVNNKYREAVPSTYVKELAFAAETKARSDIVQKGEKLYGNMAALSAALLAGKDASKEEWQALSKAYGSLEKSKVSNDKTVQNYVEALKQAYLALAAYKENQDEALLSKAQQQLLEALSTYMELVPLRS
ncbi:stage II sporulation protein D [Geobacillus sp. MR]|uniref:stage II sporulation protein D n=1 Tax=Geobacillus sp. MR TaxID=2508875 RepID=UPI00148D4996|nr:stage II sporulation protein D [Geobacillus sp. MR]NNU87716.1 stage II sporulation protein D [Geobacillus sp. MR]